MKLHRIISRPSVFFLRLVCYFAPGSARSQGTESGPAGSAPSQAANQGNSAQPRRLTLQDALALARKKQHAIFRRQQTDAAIFANRIVIKRRRLLLPSVNYNNQALYTKSKRPG